MSDTSMTLALEGDLTLDQFADAVGHFQKLVRQLSQEVAADTTIEWDLEDLHYGSAIMAVAGRADRDEPVLRVIHAYEAVGEALQQHRPIPFSAHVSREAQALTRVIDREVKSLRFSTARKESIVYGVFDAKALSSAKPMESFGSVKGRVQAISSRKSLKFTVYDSIFDRPVTCYIGEDQKAVLTDIWDKIVVVSGRVTRQPDSGQPVSVRAITSIEFVPVIAPGSYRKARGILASFGDTEPAEVSIRRLRDAEN